MQSLIKATTQNAANQQQQQPINPTSVPNQQQNHPTPSYGQQLINAAAQNLINSATKGTPPYGQQPIKSTPAAPAASPAAYGQPNSVYTPQSSLGYGNATPLIYGQNVYNALPAPLAHHQQPLQQQLMKYNPLGPGQAMIRGDRSMVSMSDDTLMMRQVLATHAPDGSDVDVGPLLLLVEDIFHHSKLEVVTMGGTKQRENEKAYPTHFGSMLDALSFTIDRISCEISYKALSGSEAHATTLSICTMLSNFSWDAKLVLTLAAFALNYGEFWLLAQIYSSNDLAKSMAILKQVPSIMERVGLLKSKFESLNNLVVAMMDVARCVVKFSELPIGHNVPEFAEAIAHIPTAVYWTIRSIIACASQITMLTGMGHELAHSPMESWELSNLAHKLKSIHDHLLDKLNQCNRYIEDKMNIEYLKMLNELFQITHIDNMKVLRALLHDKDDIQPLLDGATKRRVNLEGLRRKNVLLFISGLDISQDELSILEHIYTESRQNLTRSERDSLYEVVWVPIVDDPLMKWDNSSLPVLKKFEELQETMPWYTIQHPSLIKKPVIEFIKEKWHFRNKPILVVLDPQGRIVSPNAIHMMWIWGSAAFPFTSLKEDALWKDETWKLDLLVDGIDQVILNWIKEGKYIFLYGGDDIEWIRNFTSAARHVARDLDIQMELLYVGKSSHREHVRRATVTITDEKLSYCWQDPAMVWFFWTRLESMLFSKIQLDKADYHDIVMQGIKKLLSYDKTGGWALLSKGGEIMINGHGGSVLPTLTDYETVWKKEVAVKGVDNAIKDHYNMRHRAMHPCSRFDFHNTAGTGRIPANMKCPECHRGMVKYTTFTCCHDKDIAEPDY